MAKKLKAILESKTDDISIADVLNMQEPKVVKDGEDIFESGDGDDDDETKNEDDAKLNSGGDETIQENDEDEDDVLKEARRVLNGLKSKNESEEDDKDDEEKNESEDEDDKLDEDELNAAGCETTNQGKSGTSDTIEQSSDDGNIFEDIETIIQGDDETSADIFESEDDDKLDEEDDEEKNESEDDTDSDSKDDEVEVDENDEDDKLDESKTLSEKEQKLVMEALKIPASAQKEIKVVFESMVANKVKAEKAKLNKKFESRVEAERKQLIETLELYAKETVKKWKETNKPIFESKARMKKLEEGFKAMASVFSELGFQTVLSESSVNNKYGVLVKQNKELLVRNQKLESLVENIKVRELYESAVSGLSNNQKRKFVTLAESLEYDNVNDLQEKLATLSKLFSEGKKKYETDELSDEKPVDESDENDDNDGTILAKESKSTDLISETLKFL